MSFANSRSVHRAKEGLLRFGLKSLFVLILILSLPLSWLAAERNRKNAEREALAAIEKLGGRVQLSWTSEGQDQPPGSTWLRFLLGDDFFVHATAVDLSHNPRVSDEDIRLLAQLPKVKQIDLRETFVSDDCLRWLVRLTDLEELNLLHTETTLAGTAELRWALPRRQIVLYEYTANDGVGYERS
jgi:hypothetical protein